MLLTKEQRLSDLAHYLRQLREVVYEMSNLYENNPALNDDISIEKIVAMSLDDWYPEIDAILDKM